MARRHIWYVSGLAVEETEMNEPMCQAPRIAGLIATNTRAVAATVNAAHALRTPAPRPPAARRARPTPAVAPATTSASASAPGKSSPSPSTLGHCDSGRQRIRWDEAANNDVTSALNPRISARPRCKSSLA